jgi:S-adenosyl methyltransferase
VQVTKASSDQHWDPDLGIDITVAHPARVYDYWLGGKDNFAPDRVAGDRVLAVTPGLRYRVRANRAFLGRTVRYLAAEAGVRQFLDLGTGIPSADNTHEVAQRVAPQARVVYADNDRCNSGCAHGNESALVSPYDPAARYSRRGQVIRGPATSPTSPRPASATPQRHHRRRHRARRQ